jgi:hypothetical protein
MVVGQIQIQIPRRKFQAQNRIGQMIQIRPNPDPQHFHGAIFFVFETVS